MTTEVFYTDKALRQLRSLERESAQTIVQKIRFYSEQENPLRYAKKLKPPFNDLYRFRIGSYRVIFEVDGKGVPHVLVVLRVGDRKEIYV